VWEERASGWERGGLSKKITCAHSMCAREIPISKSTVSDRHAHGHTPKDIKSTFCVDADVVMPRTVERSCAWLGLFSHSGRYFGDAST
jgi:hypothetical protein